MSKAYSLEERIELAKQLHNNKYSYPYPQPNYKTAKDKLEIICPVHGSFYATFSDHYYKKSGCPKCAMDRMRKKKVENEVSKKVENEVSEKKTGDEVTVQNVKPVEQPYTGSKSLFW